MDEVFVCDECGKERNINDAVERGAFDILCPLCAERLQYDDNEGQLEN